jgi:DNA-binding transcriptional MerR regulator
MKYGSLHDAKIYWSTREVVGMTGVPAYTLRYWERVIPYLQVARNRAKNRAWQKKEIDFVIALKSLLENPERQIPVAEAGAEIAGEANSASGVVMPLPEKEGVVPCEEHDEAEKTRSTDQGGVPSPAAEDVQNPENSQEPEKSASSRNAASVLPAVVPPGPQTDLFDSAALSSSVPQASLTLPPSPSPEPRSADSSSPARRAQPERRHPDPAVLRNLRAELLDAIARLRTSPEKP